MKMKSTLFLIFFLFGIGFFLKAQVNPEDALLSISGKNVSVSEFMSIYKKNNPKVAPIDKKSLDEYLNLFINFKLKVREAEDLGMDTVSSFKSELKGYRDQLAKPYLIDESEIDRLVKEAYDREHYDVRVSHIFVKLDKDALPKDTLEAYKKISKIYERVKNGENFSSLAWELSEDPSARDREATKTTKPSKANNGDLGYFTVFDFAYSFENQAYNTEIGKVSPITRTEYGYHIIKVTDRKPAMGKVTVAHLYMTFPKESTSNDSLKIKNRMDSVYMKLQMGAKWDTLVKKYSEDKGSSNTGGVLPKFGVNRLVPEFIQIVYSLKNKGDYSAPFTTSYGMHIVKLIDKQVPGSFEDEKAEIKKKITSDKRLQIAKNFVYSRIKRENSFTEYPESKTEFVKVITDSIFIGKWRANEAKGMNKPIIKIGNSIITQQDFAHYLAETQYKKQKQDYTLYIDQQYNQFVIDNLIKFENDHLEQKYPDFRNLINEYRDGILLFNLTDEKVWSRAVKDTTGLKEFYEQNKNSYMWGNRVEATVFTLKDPKQAQKLTNFIKSGLLEADILKELNSDTTKILTLESGKYSKKDNKYVDEIPWNIGISKMLAADSTLKSAVLINVKKVLNSEPKTLNEARGLITADYQNFLEKIWIQYLRQKYPVIINKEVLAKIK